MKPALAWLYFWGGIVIWLNVADVMVNEPHNCQTNPGACAVIAATWPVVFPGSLAWAAWERLTSEGEPWRDEDTQRGDAG